MDVALVLTSPQKLKNPETSFENSIFNILNYDIDEGTSDFYYDLVSLDGKEIMTMKESFIGFIARSKEEINALISAKKMEYINYLSEAEYNIFVKDSDNIVDWKPYMTFNYAPMGITSCGKNEISLKEKMDKEERFRKMFAPFTFNWCDENNIDCIIFSPEAGGWHAEYRNFHKKHYFSKKEHFGDNLQEAIEYFTIPF